jgi:hypothetical protein
VTPTLRGLEATDVILSSVIHSGDPEALVVALADDPD